MRLAGEQLEGGRSRDDCGNRRPVVMRRTTAVRARGAARRVGVPLGRRLQGPDGHQHDRCRRARRDLLRQDERISGAGWVDAEAGGRRKPAVRAVVLRVRLLKGRRR